MDLIIDGRKAVLKKGSSFDYVSENRSFSDADDYTMSITLPLAGCPENLAIFGHINRMDAESRHIIFDASLVDTAICKNGVVTIVEASEAEVKVQFLEGRSAQNFNMDFNEIYLNEMQELGSYPSDSLPAEPAWSDQSHGAEAVALPWVNDSSDGMMNNGASDLDGALSWDENTTLMGKLSYQPYLLAITKRICRELHYTYDFSEWENSDDANLLICNVLPASWNMPDFARALPHWSVSEFFGELELLLVCEINIDHKAKHITLAKSTIANQMSQEVRLENIVDSFSGEISYRDSLVKYKGLANIQYDSREDEDWKMQQCQWLIDAFRLAGSRFYIEFDTEEEFLAWFDGYGKFTEIDSERGEDRGKVYHCLDKDTYYLIKVVKVNYFRDDVGDIYGYQLFRINQFSDIIHDSDSDNSMTLRCVPVRITGTDSEHGYCMFLSPSNFDEKEDFDQNGIRQPVAYSALLRGNEDSTPEYYDKIYLAYWDGHSYNSEYAYAYNKKLQAAPYVDDRFSLKSRYKGYLADLKINPKEKMKVSWLSSSIPNVRSVFYIRGRKYLCEKITATFTENGMSQLLKGEFYPLLDED